MIYQFEYYVTHVFQKRMIQKYENVYIKDKSDIDVKMINTDGKYSIYKLFVIYYKFTMKHYMYLN